MHLGVYFQGEMGYGESEPNSCTCTMSRSRSIESFPDEMENLEGI